jgi:hypothetical protein
LAKFRTSSHKLNIEIGRYHGIPAEDRKCEVCNGGKVENEIHFLLECPLYTEERTPFLTEVYKKSNQVRMLDSENLFTWIMLNEDQDHIQALGEFVHNSFLKREISKSESDNGH